MRRAVALALCLSWTVPALADQPLLRPSRDVDVTYRAAAPQGGKEIEQRVRWLAASQTMRIDPPSPNLHVIIDYVARRMSVVRDATRSVIEMAAPASMADAVGGAASTGFVRRGEAMVAGRSCVEWQTQDRAAHPALVCITDDGVLLRAGTAEQVRVSAVSVDYAPQDPTAFRVPTDYARLTPGAAR
ncbi:MAG TPA: hypothetical protein VGI78_12950 [Acetobacteraceae bacterium]